MRVWDEPAYRRLGELIDEGHSTDHIAWAMERSRGSIASAAHRAGWRIGRPRTAAQRLETPWVDKPRYIPRPSWAVNTKSFHLHLDPETHAQIKARAAKEKRHMGQVVRDLVEWGLEADGKF